MTIEIPLTQGQIALIDDEDYDLISKFKWHYKVKSKKWHHSGYAAHTIYSVKDGKCRYDTLFMHQLLIECPDGTEPDHKNGNGLDNRRSNLRIATKQQNNWNKSSIAPKKRSKYKGVYRRSTNSWCAYIGGDNKKPKHIGCFPTELDAARAYNVEATKRFGEFARLNILEETDEDKGVRSKWVDNN